MAEGDGAGSPHLAGRLIGYVENGGGQLEARDVDGEFAIDFNTSDRVSVGYSGSYELVPRPFRIATGVTVPAGGYDYGSTTVAYQAGQQRKFNGRISLDRGRSTTARRQRSG